MVERRCKDGRVMKRTTEGDSGFERSRDATGSTALPSVRWPNSLVFCTTHMCCLEA